MTGIKPGRILALTVTAAGYLSACQAPQLSDEEMRSPEACKDCHPDHYDQWSGSMHAYATDDPVYRAMQARGERETGGALGDQCMQCHAPLAKERGITDPADLDALAKTDRGVTCFVCHVMRGDPLATVEPPYTFHGPISDPIATEHESAYSDIHDRNNAESTDICQPCHEQTHDEWAASLYANPEPKTLQSCGRCHMQGRDGLAAEDEGVPVRRVHDHRFVGASVAFTEWPNREDQLAAVQRSLDTTVLLRACMLPNPRGLVVNLSLENVAAGHDWPTGSILSRRAWVELIAYKEGEVIFETGAVSEQEAVENPTDFALWLLKTQPLGAGGDPVPWPWLIEDYDRRLLPPPTTADPDDPAFLHSVGHSFDLTGFDPDRVSIRVRLRPVGHDVVTRLIEGGDLAPEIKDEIRTFTLAGTQFDWSSSMGAGCFTPEAT